MRRRTKAANEGDVGVLRCPLYVPAQPTALKRLLHLASFSLSSSVAVLAQWRWMEAGTGGAGGADPDSADPHGAPDTHYVVLAYRLRVADSIVLNPPDVQHGRYRWWRPADMRESAAVHGNTRAYVMDRAFGWA